MRQSGVTSLEASNMAATTDERRRLKHIENALLNAFAQVMTGLIKQEDRRRCYGCDLVNEDGECYDHPSQISHDICLMMDAEEKIDLVFDTVFQTVDMMDVVLVWMEDIQAMIPPAHYLEFVKFTCEDYRQMMYPTWFRQIKGLIWAFY